MGKNPSPQGWGTPPSQFNWRPQSAPFILSLPSQEAQPRSFRGGATSRLISLMEVPTKPHPPFGSHMARSAAQTLPIYVSRHTPKVCSGKSILCPKTNGWFHMPLSRVVSPSCICQPPLPDHWLAVCPPTHEPLPDGSPLREWEEGYPRSFLPALE